MALTLTSDIKLDEYSELLKKPYRVPGLPHSIQSLTLELFSLGYPPGFLTELAEELPDLKSLVVYSQLFAGTSQESKEDAIRFFEKATALRALHLLDVFAQPHFFDQVGPKLKGRERGLMFLEVNYSFRHEDEQFLERVPGLELPLLISPSLITCSFNVSVPDVTNDPDDPSNLTPEGKAIDSVKEGVKAFDQDLSSVLVDALTAEESAPAALKALNTTLYTLSFSQLRSILQKHKGLVVLNVTVELESGSAFKENVTELLSLCPSLEQFELVGNPHAGFEIATVEEKGHFHRTLSSKEDIQELAKICTKLNSFTANVLRKGSWASVEWKKAENSKEWSGGVKVPVEAKAAVSKAGGDEGKLDKKPVSHLRRR